MNLGLLPLENFRAFLVVPADISESPQFVGISKTSEVLASSTYKVSFKMGVDCSLSQVSGADTSPKQNMKIQPTNPAKDYIAKHCLKPMVLGNCAASGPGAAIRPWPSVTPLGFPCTETSTPSMM